MKTYQTGGGYFYKIYKNGKKVRISKEKFMKLKGNKQRGGVVQLRTDSAKRLITLVLDTLNNIAKQRQFSTLSGKAYLKRLHEVIVYEDADRNKTDFINMMKTLRNHNNNRLPLLNNESHKETLKICVTAILNYMKTWINETILENINARSYSDSSTILAKLKNYFIGSTQVNDIINYANSLLNPNKTTLY